MAEKNIKPQLTHNALLVLKNRCLLKDKDGNILETESQLFQRVAHHAALAEDKYGRARKSIEKEFLEIMISLDFLPSSPILMNSGTPLGQLAACFVLPLNDSLKDIYRSIAEAAQIQASGGGVGFSFSNIRPQGDLISSRKGIAAGPISFLRVFDATTQSIKQSGLCRGANMGVLKIDHPDIEEFIKLKTESRELLNFNLSVGVTDQFIEAVTNEEDFNLINPRTNEVVRTIEAKSLFDNIVQMAWGTGDPGMIFLDRINLDNPTPHLGDIESTNPCGETPLLPYESCFLGSINLSNMVIDGRFNWGKIANVVSIGVRFLDNIIDVNKYLIPEIEKMTLANRKVGLGIMGWADALIKLGIPYDSEEGLIAAEELMEYIDFYAKMASIQLARERGRFPEFEGSLYNLDPGKIIPENLHDKTVLKLRPALDWNLLRTQIGEHGIRNASVTTLAPTGTISTIADVSGGVEPFFAMAYVRKIIEQELHVINPLLQEALTRSGCDSPTVMEEVIQKGSLKDIKVIPEQIRSLFVTAYDIAPEWHVKMQAAFQKHVDNAVSKTVNLGNNATSDDVANVYLLAHKLGCKGITIYRDGCKESQVLSGGIQRDNQYLVPKPRPIPSGALQAWGQSIDTPTGRMTLFVRESDDGVPLDAFVILGRSGSDITAFTEAIGRLLSIALRSKIPVDILAENLRGLGGRTTVNYGPNRILSVPDAIGQLLWQRYCNKQLSRRPGEICPECKNASLEYSEGCLKCPLCGFSEC